MRRKIPELERALEGGLAAHQRFVLDLQLRRIEAAEADVAALDERIAEMAAPYDWAIGLLLGIPGVDRIVAITIVAEIGTDMALFDGPAQLASWAGLCPGSHESAGRRHGGKTRRGNVFLKSALVTAAVAAAKKRNSYLADKYRRLSAKRGKMRAAVAIAHKLLLTVYRILRDGECYKDLGADYLDSLDKRRVANRLTRRLNDLGFDVQLVPRAA